MFTYSVYWDFFGNQSPTRANAWNTFFFFFRKNPWPGIGAVIALLCAIQFILVVTKRMKDFPWISFRTIGGIAIICAVYKCIYFPPFFG
jgi:hypothetical protein